MRASTHLVILAAIIVVGSLLSTSCIPASNVEELSSSPSADEGLSATGNGNFGSTAGEEDSSGVCSVHEVVCMESGGEESCVDLNSSTQHCGSCGRRCFSNQQCAEGTCNGVGIVTAQELEQALKAKDFVLINVRVPDFGLIPGTDASIPHDRIDLLKEAIGEDRDQRAVLYCGTATRIRVALQLLREEGYRNISVLEDGIAGWERAGLPVAAR